MTDPVPVLDVHTPEAPSIVDAKGFIFDMDGVLYRGKQSLPGVADLFNALTQVFARHQQLDGNAGQLRASDG
jgi:hypothetical protein